MAISKNDKILTIAQHTLALSTSYLMWLLLYTHMPITQQYITDISFFNLPETMCIEAPDSITTHLNAPRAILDTLSPVVHIDAQAIPCNTPYLYQVDQKNLLVPYPIDMVHCYPQVITITKKRLDTI